MSSITIGGVEMSNSSGEKPNRFEEMRDRAKVYQEWFDKCIRPFALSQGIGDVDKKRTEYIQKEYIDKGLEPPAY